MLRQGTPTTPPCFGILIVDLGTARTEMAGADRLAVAVASCADILQENQSPQPSRRPHDVQLLIAPRETDRDDEASHCKSSVVPPQEVQQTAHAHASEQVCL